MWEEAATRSFTDEGVSTARRKRLRPRTSTDTLDKQERQTSSMARPVEHATRKRDSAVASSPWLLREKVAIPERVTGYVHRAELEDRAMPDRRRLTVLMAAAGFGKTTLLAECARRLRRRGVAVAYVSLDEHETPESLDAYVAFACEAAGLRVEMVAGEAPIAAAGRLVAVMRSIELLARPFCIAIDGLEMLGRRDNVAILDFLLRRGPANLHLAFACRQIPNGLNVGGSVLEGGAGIIGTEDLRFSRPEVARYFGLRLSRRALTKAVKQTSGWPFALSLIRNGAGRGPKRQDTVTGVAGSWIESRLFAQLTPGDRDLVLDLGLFDWIDEELLNETLGPKESDRLRSMPVLEGLLRRVRVHAADRWELHALVRTYCAAGRLREEPARFHLVHRRIAGALARRSETVAAMRHAVRGGDPILAGDILLRSGGVRIWLRQGVARYREADGLLSADAIARSPRLKLVRCAALMLSGKQAAARAVYAECSRTGSEDGEYRVDDCIVRAAMVVYGGEPVNSPWLRDVADDSALSARSPRLDATTRGCFEYGRSVLHFLKGEFDPALEGLANARELASGNSYIGFYSEVLGGQLAFFQGRVEDAEASYARARRIARRYFMVDPVAATACEVTFSELELECNRGWSSTKKLGMGPAWAVGGVPFSYFATAVNVYIDHESRAGRAEEALATTNVLLGRARRTGLATFARLLAALRVSLLVVVGRPAEAERLWRRESLPERTACCVDPAAQSLRELEAVAEARARLLIAARRYEEARRMLRVLDGVAAARSWRRTRMRAVALLVLLEHTARDWTACLGRLTEYLVLFRETPYSWPLLREGDACAEVLSLFLRSGADSPDDRAARSLLAAARAARDASEPSFTEREREILRQLPGRRIKEVAASVGLSVHGVRYHLRKLFAKLDVSTRAELLRRAEETGLVPRRS